jgi:hypothetical protein
MHYKPDLLSHLPEFMQEYRQLKYILVNDDIVGLWSATEDLTNDLYFNTLTEEGCKQWERDLKLSVGATDTLEERRFRIKAKSLEERPYSFRGVKYVLDNLCGEGNYVLSFDGFTASVSLELTVEKMFGEVVKTLERVIPLNMTLDVHLRYNEHRLFNDRTHQELQPFTHEELKKGVI